MDDVFLSPRPFHGKSEEDPELSLRHFKNGLFKNYSECQAFNAFPILLHDSVNIWFESLDTNLKDNMQHIENFKWSFHSNNFTKRSAEFWNMKQQEHQNLEDILTYCKMVGKESKLMKREYSMSY